jgi:hypothetical protein
MVAGYRSEIEESGRREAYYCRSLVLWLTLIGTRPISSSPCVGPALHLRPLRSSIRSR